MKNVVSCGIFLRSFYGWVLCHPTGGAGYDIMKGIAEEGENHFEAAKREMKEEMGWDYDCLDVIHLVDLGQHPYKRGKELHVYHVSTSTIIEPKDFLCTSYFEFGTEQIPEMDELRLATIDEAFKLLSPRISNWLQTYLPKKYHC